MKRKKVTITQIRRILKESVLDPRKIGPLQLIIEEYKDDPGYFEKKARELIIEASHVIGMSNDVVTTKKHHLPVYDEKIQKAIFFLALARCTRELIINQG